MRVFVGGCPYLNRGLERPSLRARIKAHDANLKRAKRRAELQ
jgi:hypothetical protein